MPHSKLSAVLAQKICAYQCYCEDDLHMPHEMLILICATWDNPKERSLRKAWSSMSPPNVREAEIHNRHAANELNLCFIKLPKNCFQSCECALSQRYDNVQTVVILNTSVFYVRNRYISLTFIQPLKCAVHVLFLVFRVHVKIVGNMVNPARPCYSFTDTSAMKPFFGFLAERWKRQRFFLSNVTSRKLAYKWHISPLQLGQQLFVWK